MGTNPAPSVDGSAVRQIGSERGRFLPSDGGASGIPFLSGERVYLRALVEEDAQGPYPTWFNDPEVCRGNSHHVLPYGRAAALDYIRHVNQARDSLVLAIVTRDGDRHVGNIALQGIHPVYHSAELSIVIGDRSVWGTGVGTEAAHLLCDHGFSAMNLYRIGCGTFDDNVAMRRLAAALGMREEGRRRQAAFKQGRWVDVVEYGVLAAEYAAHRAASGGGPG
jgi:ribosomal-protein-alanine N-acetyltransferase